MTEAVDRAGHRAGHLVVLRRAGSHRYGNKSRANWVVRCDCGREEERSAIVLARATSSSACASCRATAQGRRRFRHGLSDTPTHTTWLSMVDRCRNEKRDNFQHYGGRGIRVCERWKIFSNFLADMGVRPAGMTLDRVDTNGNYEPGNCRWATQTQQMRNMRKTRRLEFRGERLTVREWSERTGLKVGCLWERVYLGWPVKRILTTPSRRRR